MIPSFSRFHENLTARDDLSSYAPDNNNTHPHFESEAYQPSGAEKQQSNNFIEKYLLNNLTDPASLLLKPGVVSIEYMSDSTYIGEVKNLGSTNVKSGNGIYRYSNNEVYLGSWADDQFNGVGTYLFNNGDIYEGIFIDGVSSKGRFIYGNKDVYEGEFKDGWKHGYGTMRGKVNERSSVENTEEYEYTGYWEKDKRHGKGTFKCREYTITGMWEEDKINGEVFIQTHANEKVNNNEGYDYFEYKGIMAKSEMISGQIRIYFNKTEFYEGQVYKGTIEGLGKYTQKEIINHHETGRLITFDGHFKQGKISSYGIISANNFVPQASPLSRGIRYEGNFDQFGLPHGKGKMNFLNGDKYDGNWISGYKNGFGVYLFANGDFYEGNFRNDGIEGKGKYFWKKENLIFNGDFFQNKIVQPSGQHSFEGPIQNSIRPQIPMSNQFHFQNAQQNNRFKQLETMYQGQRDLGNNISPSREPSSIRKF